MEIHKIDGDYLKNLFNSKEFSDALEKCGNITHKRGVEASFTFLKQFSSPKIFLESILKGGCSAMQNAEKIYEHPDIYDTFSGYDLIKVHFHPEKDFTILPSSEDMITVLDSYEEECLENNLKYKIKGLSGIAKINNNKKIKMLLLQPCIPIFEGAYEEFEEKFSEDFYFLESTKNKENEVKKILESTGYFRVKIIDFEKKDGMYNPKNLKGIEKFAFTPKLKI
jgi:hypothetical protein